MNIANASPKENIINFQVYFLLDFPLCLGEIAIIKHVQFSIHTRGFYRCDHLVWCIFLWPGRPLISLPPPPFPATPDISDEVWPLC